jgi:hypothetical protein
MTSNWLTDELIEPFAIAICYSGFNSKAYKTKEEMPWGGDPVAYWGHISESVKVDYRKLAKHAIITISGGMKLFPPEVDEKVLEKYMQQMRLSNKTNAKKHFQAMYNALSTIWEGCNAEVSK